MRRDGVEEWKECKLGDIVEINPTESLKKGTVAKKIGMDVLQPYCRAIPSFSFEPYTGGTKFKNGDTIMARITPCLENGKTAMVNILDDNEIGFGSTEYIVFRAKNNITDPYFIYYLVTSDCIRNPAIKSMVGSSGRQRVQTDVVANLSINLPPLPTQQKIATILSSLDDKIELNNKINTNLEQQAQALFKNWFVDCMNSTTKMSDIIDVRDGTHDSPKPQESGYLLVTSKHLEAYSINPTDANFITKEDYDKINERSKVDNGDILLSMIGTVGIVSLVIDNPVTWAIKNMGLFKTSKVEDLKYYLLNYLKSDDVRNYIEQHLAGSTQKYISLSELRNLPINIPEKNILEKFNNIVTPIYEQIVNNTNEIKNLKELRDTLLPKLMNGEIFDN